MRLIESHKVIPLVRLILMNHPKADAICENMQEIVDIHTIEAEPVKHGRWEKVEGSSRWEQHRCSVCKKEATFKYEYIDDYDDDMDGEWEYIGQRENGITEYLTDYCPNCGAKMNKEA